MNSFCHFPSTNQIDNRMMLLLPLLNHIQFHENDWLGKIQDPCRYLPWKVQQAWGLVASRTHSWGPWACVPPVHPRKKAYKNHTTQFNQMNFINTKRKRKFVALFQCSLNDSSLNIILYLAEVKRIPFTPPKVESETNTGMIHHIIPYSLLENIYNMQFKTITTINLEPSIFNFNFNAKIGF